VHGRRVVPGAPARPFRIPSDPVQVVAKRGAGDYLGEIALDNRPRTATIVATTPVVIEVIGRREFFGLVADVPEIGQAIMATMAQRLSELGGITP
jgi:CRP-like cAMP-binding protein